MKPNLDLKINSDKGSLSTNSSFNPQEIVNITEYSTSTSPFGGKLKSDIADFIVREITTSREIISSKEKKKSNMNFNPKRDKCTIFTVIKKKMDTIIASKIIAEFLGIPSKFIKWAGIKDHTAITAQRFSVRGNMIEKLSNFSHNNITITNIHPAYEELELGKLWGNNFSINIRRLIAPYESLKNELMKWEEQINILGFPNYFGSQRFGQHRPNSHKVGKLIFLQNFKEACEEFLYKFYPKEFEENAKFRKAILESKDYEYAAKNCPHSLYYEKLIFQQLHKDPLNFKRALLSLPIPLINLIMSSYQSYLFNTALSKRIKKGYPLSQPIKGDLIAILMEPRGHPSLVSYKYEGGEGMNDNTILKAFKLERATIIAPIVGHFTDFADFPLFQEIYQEILEIENFKIEYFRHNIPRLFNFEGTFRPIFNKPSSLKISKAYHINKYPEVDPNALKIDFSLPKGTYATIFLRELHKKSLIIKNS